MDQADNTSYQFECPIRESIEKVAPTTSPSARHSSAVSASRNDRMPLEYHLDSQICRGRQENRSALRRQPAQSRAQAILHLGAVSKLWTPSQPNVNKATDLQFSWQGPGLDFVHAVLERSDPSRLEDSSLGLQLGAALSLHLGQPDDILVDEFIDVHPYFSHHASHPKDREVYREKMAFYLVKRGVMNGVAGIDIVASAMRLVAECIVRHCEEHDELWMGNVTISVQAHHACTYTPCIISHIQASLPRARLRKTNSENMTETDAAKVVWLGDDEGVTG